MLPQPSSPNVATATDWIEASCIVSEDVAISRSDVLGALNMMGESNSEDQADAIWLQLFNRQTLVDDGYPFAVEQEAIQQRDPTPARNAYLTMLLISTRAYVAEAGTAYRSEHTRLFEYITTEAARRYVSGEALRIGSPREAPVPANFREMVEYLSGRLNEGPTGDVLNPADKDAGADVLAWRPFADGRAGQLILLAQCATGADWKTKAADCQVEEWRRYIQFVVEPLRVLAIPHIEPDAGRWIKYSARGGVILDRVRITEMLEGDTYPDLADSLAVWLEAEVERLREVEIEAGFD